MALRTGPSETMLTHNSIGQFGAPGSWSLSTGLHFRAVTYAEVEQNLIADLSDTLKSVPQRCYSQRLPQCKLHKP